MGDSLRIGAIMMDICHNRLAGSNVRHALRKSRPRHDRVSHSENGGFTLLELLVALVIIGIVVSVAVLALGGNQRAEQAHTEARRLAALIGLASQQAVVQSRSYGVRFSDTGYRFLVHDTKWKASADRMFRARALPDGLHLEVSQDGRPLPAPATAGNKTAPQIVITSDGDRTPFEAQISAPDDPASRYTVTVPEIGKISVTGPP